MNIMKQIEIPYYKKTKQYQELNRDVISQKRKEFYERNKDAIRNYRNTKHNCPTCGGRYTNAGKAQHFKTKLHLNSVSSSSSTATASDSN